MKKRVISAIVMLAVSFVFVFASEYTRVIFFAVVGIACAYELSRNLEKLDIYCSAWVAYVYIAAQAVLALFHAGAVAYIACMTACIYLALFSGIIRQKVSGHGAIYTVFALAYPGFIFGVLMMISVTKSWLDVFVLACLATWICDSFALFGGMRFGKHKIAPHVSPKKTVEGCICGAIAGALTGVLIYYIPGLCEGIPLWLCVLTCFVASTLGQVGDLAESLVKRMIGVKDFSNLIPGHGGAFDRVDSLLFSIPTAYLCLFIFGYIV
ncbi:MAG: phosphatidate cytidylyltransferase [Candidatus Limivicinus sp.]